MKCWLAKRGGGFIPTDDDSRTLLGRMEDAECAQFEVVRPRSLRWHRMYFAICREIGQNQDPPRDEASIDSELRVRGGHFDVLIVEGHEVRVPKRIAFSRLTADEWQSLWPSIETAIREHFGEGYVRELAA